MSLKTFHLVFVTLSVVLCIGCAALALNELVLTGDLRYGAGLVVALLGTAALGVYEVRVVRKFRTMGLSHPAGR